MTHNLKKKVSSCSGESKHFVKWTRTFGDLKPLIKPTLIVCDHGSDKIGQVGELVVASLECLISRTKMLGCLRNMVGRLNKIVETCELKNSRLIEYEDLVERISILCSRDHIPPYDKSQENRELFRPKAPTPDPVEFGLKMLKYLDEFVKRCWVPANVTEALSYFEDVEPADSDLAKVKVDAPNSPQTKTEVQQSNSDQVSASSPIENDLKLLEEWKTINTTTKVSPQTFAKFYKDQDSIRENNNISQEYLAHFCRSIIREIALNECLKQELFESSEVKQKYLDLVKSVDSLAKICELKLVTSPTLEYARKLYITYSCNRIHNYYSTLTHLKTYKTNYIKIQKQILNSIDQQLREMHLNKATMQKVFNENISRIKRDAEILVENEEDRSTYEGNIDKHMGIFLENRKTQWAREKLLMETKVKLDEDIHYIEKQYTQTVEELESSLDETMKRQSEHATRQIKLDAEYQVVKKLFDDIMTERFWTFHQLEIKAETRVILTNAAIKIQTWWRSYRVRKIMRKKMASPQTKKRKSRLTKSR